MSEDKYEYTYDGRKKAKKDQLMKIIFTFLVILTILSYPPVHRVLSEIVTDWFFPNKGQLYTVNCEVYWDPELTQNVTSIDWGVFDPGEIKQKVVYVYNGGNRNISLSIATSDWLPDGVGEHLVFTPHYIVNRTMVPGEIYSVGLELSVNLDVDPVYTDFSFEVHVIGKK